MNLGLAGAAVCIQGGSKGMGRAAADLLADCDVLHVHEFRTAENLLVTPLAAKWGVPLALTNRGAGVDGCHHCL